MLARINVEESWYHDPRREMLEELVGKDTADGVALRFWRLSQDWKDGFIPKNIFETCRCWKEFESAGLAKRVDGGGVYICGAKDHHAWIEKKRKAGALGGAKSGEARRSKTKQMLGNGSIAEPSSSSSYSYSKRESTKKRPKGLSPLAQKWNQTCVNLPRVLETSNGRAKKEAARVEKFGEEQMVKAMEKLAASRFCHGDSDRGWKATYDFLIASDENVLKILEGKYDDKITKQLVPMGPRRIA